MKHMKQIAIRAALRHFLYQRQGNVTIELAFVLGFMILAFAGLVELTAYIDAKQRVNKIANQTASVLSSIPSWSGTTTGQIRLIVNMGAKLALPERAKVRARFCKGNQTVAVGGNNVITSTNVQMSCGLGPGQSTFTVTPQCTESGPGSQQYVTVVAFCSYRSLIRLPGLNLPKSGARVQETVTVPMRYKMEGGNW